MSITRPLTRQPSRRLPLLQGMVALILCLWLCVFLHIPLYNVGGGEGVWLPLNIVAWAMAVTVILLTALLQCRFSLRIKRLFLWCLTFATCVQGLTVMAGLFRPALLSPLSRMFLKTAGRQALGIFQQVNVTASFVATGFALAMGLFCRGGLYHDVRRWHDLRHPLLFRLQAVYLLTLMAFLPCTLVLTRSRIGWLGGLTVYIVAVSTTLLTSYRQSGRARGLLYRYKAAILFIPLTGVAAGLSLLDCSVAQAIDHGGSNYQRWLTLKVTWEMIRLHPWAGWGIGSFMMQFQHYIASHYHPNPSREFMGHPHNEILYVWMEGGILALAGLVMAGCAAGTLFMKNRSPARRLLAMAMLPVLLHTMVEFPLYLSAPHALVLLLISLNLDHSDQGASSRGATGITVPREVDIPLRSIIVTISFWLLTSLQCAYRENALLSRYEAGELPLSTIRKADIPWMLTLRYDADRLNMKLDEYGRNGDPRLLHEYVMENGRWLKTHTDPDNYVSQVAVLHYLNRGGEACHYQREGHQIFPRDRRLVNSKCR